MMKTQKNLATLCMLSFMASFSPHGSSAEDLGEQIIIAQNASAPGTTEATEKYYENELMKKHEIVAKYYEDEAKKMQAKVKELKALLEHYEDKSYIYGKKAQDLQAHTEALVRKYEQGAASDAKEAASHRQIALRLKEKNYAASNAQQLAIGGPNRTPNSN
jgi:glucan-binding YG repeat protein